MRFYLKRVATRANKLVLNYTTFPRNVSGLFDLVFPLGKQNSRTWIPTIADNCLEFAYWTLFLLVSELKLLKGKNQYSHEMFSTEIFPFSYILKLFWQNQQKDTVPFTCLTSFCLPKVLFIWFFIFLETKKNTIGHEIQSHRI